MTWLHDDLGIPSDYRHMDGFGVHTYKLVARDGRETLVKFHWKTRQGLKCLVGDEPALVGGRNHSHATQDLYDAIERGEYPEWTLCLQLMDPRDEDKYDFDPLDPTKTWPEDQFPLQPVGRMVLNQNPDNFFAENEQLAFCPSLVVPGITYSDDKLLQSRLFSYADTQRYRLGPNYLMLPANAPKCPFHNNHHEGPMNFMHREGEVNYFPSRVDQTKHAQEYPVSQARLEGPRSKAIIRKENNFKQAGDRWRSFDRARQQRFVDNFCQWLCHPRTTREAQQVWVGYWTQCDPELGRMMGARVQQAQQAHGVAPTAAM